MNRLRFFGSALFLAFWVALPLAAQTPAPLPPETVEKIEKIVTGEMERQKVPGLSVAVMVNNRIVYEKGLGLADLEGNVPARATTVYRTGSVAKPITAVAVLQLAERGQLDLDAPIRKYCPAFPEKPWPVTARQLLGHLGGVRHYKSPEEFDSTRHYDKLAPAMEMFKDDALLHEPGTKYSYTTFGYVVLGCAIEGASGMSYVDYLRENIFRPAGMHQSGADHAYAIIPNRTRFYHRTESGELENAHLADTSNKVPGGGLVSTASDLVRFALALDAGGLLKPQTREQMWNRQKTRDGKETTYGLGWFLEEKKGRKWAGHSGGQQGTRTHLLLLPGQGFAVAVMANVEPLSFEAILNGIVDLLLPEPKP